MAALEPKEIEALLATWDEATAPVDAREREDPLLFASAPEIVALYKNQQPKQHDIKAIKKFSHPWDHADFLARVSSFSIATWFAKPEIINAFECSRFGWRNSGPDMLSCICCKQILCFKIDNRLSESGVLNVAKIFAQQLITGHTLLCPWRGNPSPVAFTMLPIASKRQVYEGFMDQLEKFVAQMLEDAELLKLVGNIKVLDEVTDKILNEVAASDDSRNVLTTTTLASKLSASIYLQRDTPVSHEVLVNATFIVGCGWQSKVMDHVVLLKCGFCNRHWQASPAITSNENDDDMSEPKVKRLKLATSNAVDLLSQHRQFCPWITGRKLAGADEVGHIDLKLWEFVRLPGWRQYAQCLELLRDPDDCSLVADDSSNIKKITHSDPAVMLRSVQAVLGL
ncbi:Uncharacterized conserved protein [Plasmopara halstedii]|uniref:Uncharacterized conserved protein n=1 Tax=Plasmopara halstedii TaxID=4781 RepID=A0A0P1B7G8_PLAHL|nr:Uncharacterized conserved protein [Plasmopara halstedii]CEG49881.1 Uncharacterized conserved protein [Plasmopara halstedii]|eukprot:XP_024586250.1 Uncharacterized conserved protein [Plasmopara halstedii]